MADEDQTQTGRNLILCSDGTGQRGGKTLTNVWRIYQAVDRTSTKPEQLAFYEDGVGVEDFKPFKAIGGATGAGLSHNIRLLYRWLILNYREDDQIYLFGFSRGAYTVRTFAGMLKHCGLVVGDNLHGAHAEKISKEVYGNYYRGRLFGRLFGQDDRSRKSLPCPYTPAKVKVAGPLNVVYPKIRFLGVWDTVGAVGIPPWLRAGKWSPMTRIFRFHDINANNWQAAGHAMAIDDERKSFWPEPLPKAPDGNDEIAQVWFAGVHSNVGGGYPKDGLAFSTLDWMMTKAKKTGLVFSHEVEAEVRHRSNAHDRIYNPRAGVRAYFRYSPRDFSRIEREFKKRYCRDNCEPHPLGEIHEDVFERIQRSTSGYAPQQLPAEIKVVATGKGKGGSLDSGEQQRVADYQNRLINCNQSGRGRIDTLRGVNKRTWMRKTLYWLLILFTIALAFDVIWLMDSRQDVDAFGKLVWPLPWVAKAGSLVLPKFAEDLVARLLQQATAYPKTAITIVILFVIALVSRQQLKKKSEWIALEAWHSFRI